MRNICVIEIRTCLRRLFCCGGNPADLMLVALSNFEFCYAPQAAVWWHDLWQQYNIQLQLTFFGRIYDVQRT